MNYWRRFFAPAAIAGAMYAGGTVPLAGAGTQDSPKDRAEADALFTNGVVLQLRIEVPRTNVAALRQRPHKYVSATVREGDRVYTDVAVHLKGSAGSFRPIDDKPGLTLKFNSSKGGSLFHGLKRFHLNNSVQDPSYVSELICDEMFRGAGLPATQAAHALVELNGRKLGLFVLIEAEDKRFLSRYFPPPHGNVYGQPGNCEITDPIERMWGHEPLNRAELKALVSAVQEPNAARRAERLQQTLDVDRFLSFMALEVMLDHWDGYTFSRHNYRVYHDIPTNRIVFMPHDLDQVIRNPNLPIVPGVNGIVSQAIVNTPELRRRYLDRFAAVFTNVFVVSILSDRIDEVVGRIRPALKAYDANLAREVENQANGLKQRIASRGQFLVKQLNVPKPETLKFENNIARITAWRPGVKTGNAEQARTNDASGKASLWISATGQSKFSWRKRVRLDPGHYRFEGLARCTGIVPFGVARKGEGAGLRISRPSQPRENKLSGDSPWQKLTYEFDAPPEQEVELICELCATKGEVWFDADSLQLVRVR